MIQCAFGRDDFTAEPVPANDSRCQGRSKSKTHRKWSSCWPISKQSQQLRSRGQHGGSPRQRREVGAMGFLPFRPRPAASIGVPGRLHERGVPLCLVGRAPCEMRGRGPESAAGWEQSWTDGREHHSLGLLLKSGVFRTCQKRERLLSELRLAPGVAESETGTLLFGGGSQGSGKRDETRAGRYSFFQKTARALTRERLEFGRRGMPIVPGS